MKKFYFNIALLTFLLLIVSSTTIAQYCYQDYDGDGYGDPATYVASTIFGCPLGGRWVTNALDCNDGDLNINPNTVWYKDFDNDGYPDGTTITITQCARPASFYKYANELKATSVDCDDNDPYEHPFASWHNDPDNDGYTDNPGSIIQIIQCTEPPGNYVSRKQLEENGSIVLLAGLPRPAYAFVLYDCNQNDPLEHPNQKWYKDGDGDKYTSNLTPVVQCSRPAGGYAAEPELASLTILDCDDANPAITIEKEWYKDADNDGFTDEITPITQCSRPANHKLKSEIGMNIFNPTQPEIDCDDNNPILHPFQAWYKDDDRDKHGAPGFQTSCTRPAGHYVYSELIATDDCNDDNAKIYPNAPELCDGLDNDCDGETDEGVQTLYAEDKDGDGVGNNAVRKSACSQPAGYVSFNFQNSDCNDNDPDIAFPKWYTLDADKDGYGENTGDLYLVCAATAPIGYASNNTDCDDNDPQVHSLHTFYWDDDHDGYGDPNNRTTRCDLTPPRGYVGNGNDCDDDNAEINPNTIWYKDADNDGYSDGSNQQHCARPAGYKLSSELIATSGDCDDNDGSVNLTLVWYKDADNDGYSDGATQTQCTRPAGYKLASELTATSGDCDDNISAINPATVWYKDADNDGYSSGATQTQCTRPAGYKPASELLGTNNDCNDDNGATKPGATEVCDGVDNDCDGLIDEGVKTTFYRDADVDGYGNPSNSTQACSVPAGYVSNKTDCNDTKASVHPGAAELCNGIDDDCDGQVDEGCNRTVSINDVSVTEGNSGTKNMAFTIKLNAAATRSCSVKYQTFNSTAIAGTDYTAKSGTVSFATGEITKTVNISIIGNLVCEPNEQFKVQLSAAVNLVIGTQNGIGTITNDDIPGIKISNVSLVEGNSGTKPFPFNVTLDKPSYQTVSVKYATANGSASSGSDYISTNGTLTFSAGQTSKTINVIVKGDNNPEPDETFKVVLTNPVNAIIITGTGTGTIKKYNTATRSSAAPENIVSTAPPIALTTTVWPNPAADVVNIKLDNYTSSKVTLQLVDRNGARIKEWKFSPSLKQNTYQLNIAGLAQGLYLIRITDEKGNTKTEKIVIGR